MYAATVASIMSCAVILYYKDFSHKGTSQLKLKLVFASLFW